MRTSERIKRQQETGRLVLDNILFATDFSPASEVGLRYALALARHYHGKISMVPAVAMDYVEAISDDARQRALEQSRVRALNWVAQVQVSGELHGVRHALPTGEGAQESPLRSLENQSFDLAINGIVCHEGRTVSLEPRVEEAIRKSECPVLTMGSQFYARLMGK